MSTSVRAQVKRFGHWLLTVESRPFLAILGAFSLTWGAFLVSPWVDTFDSSPLYGTLVVVAPETAWGLLAMVVGGWKIYHAFRPVSRGAVWASWLSVFMWSFIVAGFAVSARLTTALPVYGWVLVWNAWLAYRIRGEYLGNGGD